MLACLGMNAEWDLKRSFPEEGSMNHEKKREGKKDSNCKA